MSIRPKTREDIRAAVHEAVRYVACVSADTAVPASQELGRDAGVVRGPRPPLHLDAIDAVEIVLIVEIELGVYITDEALQTIDTVGQLVDHVCKLAGITTEETA